ncbi:MAG TPA: hypothetical protein VFQ68_31635, partial [Streptosporangiaceae bacterium]|nr:hypothetical protein [Streptosporangiaceae bacterium]
MFAGDELLLDVGFAVAWERLTQLAVRGMLAAPAADAYGGGSAGLVRVGAAGISKVVQVQVRELARADRSGGLAIRWEATGPGGGLFPVLDADIRLVPAGEHSTMLTMTGVYRPPFGPLGESLDRAVLHRVADATIRGFTARVAAQITGRSVIAEAAAPGKAEASPSPAISGAGG